MQKTENISAAREEFIFERKYFMKFKVVGKSLILTDYSHKITEGENSFDTVEIAVPNSHDDCDLSTLSFRFSEISEDGKSSAVQMLRHTKCDEKYIYLKGKITSDFSAITGKVTFMLTGVSGENVVAKFQSDTFTIGDDISRASLPNGTVAEQLFNQAQLEVQKAIAAAERAEIASQTPAPAEIYPASETNLGGVKVDGKTITASEDGTISALDSKNIKNEIAELKSLMGFTDNDIIGLHADFENNIFTRLAGAVDKTAGSDFDIFPMYGGRKRCNVLDDGTITAYYGDNNFAEDGSNGQVMVYQPKFYYKVVPLKLDPQTGGCGYHLRSANYYISATPKNGFKLHPAFYDEDSNPVDYILFSAYEGSIYDTSTSAYLHNDEQIADFSADKLSSVAGVRPCSGKTQNLTRVNVENLSKNRGIGWHTDTIKTASANQLLTAVEYAAFNMQETIGLGVVNITDISHENCAIVTGKTSSFGNLSIMSNGVNGQTSVSYRGMENPWGNIFKFINGINGYMTNDGIFHIYVCDDFNFSESKGTDNYKAIGYNPAHTNGYVSAFGYSEEYDWLFIASETIDNSNLPIGDYYLSLPTNKNQWRVVLFGGAWYEKQKAGAFEYSPHGGIGLYDRAVGGRLVYVPASKL